MTITVRRRCRRQTRSMFELRCAVCDHSWSAVEGPPIAAVILEDHYRNEHPWMKESHRHVGRLTMIMTMHQVRRLTGTPA